MYFQTANPGGLILPTILLLLRRSLEVLGALSHGFLVFGEKKKKKKRKRRERRKNEKSGGHVAFLTFFLSFFLSFSSSSFSLQPPASSLQLLGIPLLPATPPPLLVITTWRILSL